MKTCFACGEAKPINEFYQHKEMADGHLNKCKECTKSDVRTNRRKRSDYYRQLDRDRGNRWRAGYRAEYKASNPDRVKAQSAVSNAIRDGKLKKSVDCEMCGSTEHIEAHHPDYSHPLTVWWLCSKCHKRLHALMGRCEKQQSAE